MQRFHRSDPKAFRRHFETKSAGILFIDPSNRVYLLDHPEGKTLPFGKRELHEYDHPDITAFRETEEETGVLSKMDEKEQDDIRVRLHSLLNNGKTNNKRDEIHTIVKSAGKIFVLHVTNPQFFVDNFVPNEETTGCSWVPIEDIKLESLRIFFRGFFRFFINKMIECE